MLGLSPGAIQYVVILIFVFLSASVWLSQKKFKDKMLCYFIRPNKQRIEKWAPMTAKRLKFDKGKYKESYKIIPRCISLQYYDRGFNKLWGTWIPTLEFRWDSEYPLDPETFEPVNLTPEEAATMESGEDWQQFNKATREGGMAKGRFPEWFLPLCIVAVLLVVLFVYWRLSGQIAHISATK